jgi:hypothetical protein
MRWTNTTGIGLKVDEKLMSRVEVEVVPSQHDGKSVIAALG